MNVKVLSAGVAAVAVAGALIAWQSGVAPPEPAQPSSITSAQLTPSQEPGRKAFEERCASCHGQLAQGTDRGPPLVHKIYEPSHHADAAFEHAARFGVRAHHWNFGNMPPVAGITTDEVRSIIDFVRTLQRANGIG